MSNTRVGVYKNSDIALVYMNDSNTNNWNNSASSRSGLSYTVSDMANGVYDITYVNTYTGSTISTGSTTVTTGNLVLNSIPSLTRDIAIQAVKQGAPTQHPNSRQIGYIQRILGFYSI